MIACTRCGGTGFLNNDQIPEELGGYPDKILEWLDETAAAQERLGGCSCFDHPPCGFCMNQHEVQVCDCCGDGNAWYGEPGKHYGVDDPMGKFGPYARNGGLCECH